MDFREHLENVRAVIFTGKPFDPNVPYRTQEEYIELYEMREDRDPLKEYKALEKAAAPLLPHYEKKLEQIAKMEAFLNGEENDDEWEEDEFEKNAALESLHEEIATMDTEDQWLKFIEQF